MYKKHKRSYWVKAFMISYALAFLTLGFFAFLAVSALAPGESDDYREELSLYLPEAEDSRTVLMLLLDEEKQPLSCTLVSFNALRQEIPVTTLPPQTAVSCFGERVTLQEAFRDGGMGRVKDSLEESFKITVEGCLQLDSESLPAAADVIGALEFYLPYTLKYGESAAEISEGLQLFGGQLLYKTAAFKEFPGGEESRCKLISELTAAYIDKYLSKFTEEGGDYLFKKAVSEVKTDISFKDFEEFGEALAFLAQRAAAADSHKLTYTVTADGSFNSGQNSFALSQSFEKKLSALM